jgi:hypothetical protein
MSILAKAIRGKVARPRATLIYGIEGIGKTTFACSAPDPFIIQTEDGAADIEDVGKLDVCKTFSDFNDQITALLNEEHEFKSVIVDSVDWLEALQSVSALDEYNKANAKAYASLDEIPYGAGPKCLEQKCRDFLVQCDRLRARGISVILIAHSEIKKFSPPDMEPYERYMPALGKHTCAIYREYCDEVLFLNYKVNTVEKGKSFGVKTFQAIGGRERMCYAQERPSHLAKNRKGLPEEFALPQDKTEYSLYWRS